MANDELIAALERTAVWCEALALCDPRDLEALVKSRHETDAALIRAHIETLRAVCIASPPRAKGTEDE